MKVSRSEINLYAEWRRRSSMAPSLREDAQPPPERLLQAVWHHQRLLRDELTTLDGRPLQLLHPGFWNREAGPDFRGAVVRLAGEPPREGDVEIDLRSSGWRAHGHDRNAAFKNVVLHVVWEGDSKTTLPTLALKSFLDSPLGELLVWLGSEGAQDYPGALAGRCCAPLRELSPDRLMDLLRQASLTRLQAKAAQFEARARQAGWERAWWEGLFRALGYKHNVWPMHRLAELRARLSPSAFRGSPLALQARLFGVSGLLPDELTRSQAGADRYLRRVWDAWWREREAFEDCLLPRSLWRFGGSRPANHPQRRLALAAHWWIRGDLVARVERWCITSAAEPQLLPTMLDILQVREDEFWSWHWTLRSKTLGCAQPLLGAARVTDLAMNVVLPWLWVRADRGKNAALKSEIERRYLAWPASEDNATLRLARQRLLGSTSRRPFNTAAAQQGLLQIVRDFCEHSNALCANCQFPDLVRRWAG